MGECGFHRYSFTPQYEPLPLFTSSACDTILLIAFILFRDQLTTCSEVEGVPLCKDRGRTASTLSNIEHKRLCMFFREGKDSLT